VTGPEWIEAFASRLGVGAPDEATRARLPELAGVAAHASERQAAPIACWLAARVGVDPERALALAREIAP